ncbi:MAG: altronate dehydratase family protein [Bacteroidota bacterium]
MKNTFLKIHPKDNIIAALQTLAEGTELELHDGIVKLQEEIPIKHKFTTEDIQEGDAVYMYGVLVGRASKPIKKGGLISTENLVHDTDTYSTDREKVDWTVPDITRFVGRKWKGYHRSDGRVGTANYWLVIPLVFCENRNVRVMQESLVEALGYATDKSHKVDIGPLLDAYKNGADAESLLGQKIHRTQEEIRQSRPFSNIDGIKFLTHEGGCGGTREDSETLCRLFASYINHPNVGGATVLSLGCQNAQIISLEKALERENPNFDKPLYILEQQKSKSEPDFLEDAIKQTFVGLTLANQVEREEAPLDKLSLGLECGGSDGFSGISANPALGYASDLLVALKGQAILAEFPELNGVEQELINRCETSEIAEKFSHLMRTYAERAEAVGSGFENNPSPGNIKDGLITDAIKSAGAAKKGGTSPVRDVLDYTEVARKSGLHLLCTPGGDVESTTGLASAGANVIVFTTGLGTPTGNPISPVLKMSTNNALYQRMRDIIDINAGTIITGEDSIQSKGEELLELIIQVASGAYIPAAVRLGQDDFIPWKRGVSL